MKKEIERKNFGEEEPKNHSAGGNERREKARIVLKGEKRHISSLSGEIGPSRCHINKIIAQNSPRGYVVRFYKFRVSKG